DEIMAMLDEDVLNNLSQEQLDDLQENAKLMLQYNRSYLDKWLPAFQVYKQFDWARLNNELAPADIKLALNVFNDMRVPVGEIDIDNFDMESPQLERELEFINSIVAEIRKENMNIESTVDRW